MKTCINCNKDFLPLRKDQKYCNIKCANTFRSKRWRALGKEKLLRDTPKGKYHVHKTNAGNRGISFNLSFDEWWEIWEPHWSLNNYGKLCMCRKGDEGPYEKGNVRIDTWGNNYREARNLPLL